MWLYVWPFPSTVLDETVALSSQLMQQTIFLAPRSMTTFTIFLMNEFLLKKILSRVLNGDQVVWDVDRSLIGVLPLGSSKKLGIVFTEEVEHTEPGHVVEEDVLNNQKNTH